MSVLSCTYVRIENFVMCLVLYSDRFVTSSLLPPSTLSVVVIVIITIIIISSAALFGYWRQQSKVEITISVTSLLSLICQLENYWLVKQRVLFFLNNKKTMFVIKYLRYTPGNKTIYTPFTFKGYTVVYLRPSLTPTFKPAFINGSIFLKSWKARKQAIGLSWEGFLLWC